MLSQPEIWQPARASLRLNQDEVHVWRASLEQDEFAVQALWELLSQDERQRADRFHFKRDRRHFIVRRGMLRDVLIRYLGKSHACLTFTCNEFGKPRLAGYHGNLRFNLSHSNGLALCALARGREIGIDVEYLRADLASLEIAERFFSRAEVRVLRSLPEHQRTQAFFNCWTRKEAYVKALGKGLSQPLHLFAVSLRPGEPARLVSTNDDPEEAAKWSLVELSPRKSYAAAVSVQGNMPKLRCWQWRMPQ